MNCPACATLLLISEREGVEIDYCPECRGVWLDRGELDKIIARAGEPIRRDHDDDVHDGVKQHRDARHRPAGHNNPEDDGRRRKGGFWSNLFEFD